MAENGSIIGAIDKQKFLSTDYAVRLTKGSGWVFRVPSFTVAFEGTSGTGAKVQAHLASELVRHVLIDEGQDSLPLVASLAFVHSERCRT